MIFREELQLEMDNELQEIAGWGEGGSLEPALITFLTFTAGRILGAGGCSGNRGGGSELSGFSIDSGEVQLSAPKCLSDLRKAP